MYLELVASSIVDGYSGGQVHFLTVSEEVVQMLILRVDRGNHPNSKPEDRSPAINPPHFRAHILTDKTMVLLICVLCHTLIKMK